MAIFTLPEIEEQIAAWKAALTAASTGQEYAIGGRRLTRADLPEIRSTLEWLDSQRTALANSGKRGLLVVGRPAR